MDAILQSIILGIIQGITEWLPVSSSAHLTLFQKLFNFNPPLVYDVFLHIGSLVAIIIFLWKDIVKITIGCFKLEKKYLLYLSYMILATIPIALIGYFFNDFLKNIFGNLKIIGILLLITAILLYFSKYPKKKNKTLNFKNTFFIGLIQSLSLLPGISRSGSTISLAFMQGIKKEDAVKFSFLIFIPAILGASILELKNFSQIDNCFYLGIAMITTIIVGLLTLKILMYIIKKDHFYKFSYYCLALGLITIILSF